MLVAQTMFDIRPSFPVLPGWPADVPEELYPGWDTVPEPKCPLCQQRNLWGRVNGGPGPDSYCSLRVGAALRDAGLHVHEQSEALGYCADLVVPLARIVIEYDGEYWHRNTAERDEQQRHLAAARGYQMVRLREPGLTRRDEHDLQLIAAFDRWGRTAVRAQIVSRVIQAVARGRRTRPL